MDTSSSKGMSSLADTRARLHVISHRMCVEFTDVRSLSMPIAADTFFSCDLFSLAVHLGAQELGRLLPSHLGSVDVAYSNFGPLNCVPDLSAVGRAMADLVRPGGHAVFTVIDRVCPWEVAHYVRERRWSRVAVRYRRGMTAVGMNGHTIWTRYHTPGGFVREWTRGSSAWESVRVEGLSTFVPPPYLAGTPAARPDRLVRLERLDAATSAWPVMRSIGDHFLVVLRRA